MSASLSIIRIGNKNAYASTGEMSQIAKALAEVAFNDVAIANAITRAADEINKKKLVDQELIRMTQKQ